MLRKQELALQNFLRQSYAQKLCRKLYSFLGNSLSDPLEDLQGNPWFLKVNRHPNYINLVQFTYNSIDSPKYDPIIKECRGIILDEENNWNVVSYPFNRFYNDGDYFADEIDWDTAVIQEKVDGTLIGMYHYDGKWHVSTKGSPSASGPVASPGRPATNYEVPVTIGSFANLFWDTFYKQFGSDMLITLNPNITYCFELTSPYNRIVCKHQTDKLTLIGMRDRRDFKQTDISGHLELNPVKQFSFTNVEEIRKACGLLDPLEQEGYVVHDANFNRIKIKSATYLALSHTRDGSLHRRLMDMVKINASETGKEDAGLMFRFLEQWPEEQKLYTEMYLSIDKWIKFTEKIYNKIKHIESQKEFASHAVKISTSGILFSMRAGKIPSIRQGIVNMETDKLLELMNKECNEKLFTEMQRLQNEASAIAKWDGALPQNYYSSGPVPFVNVPSSKH